MLKTLRRALARFVFTLLPCLAAVLPAAAQTASLVKDVNPGFASAFGFDPDQMMTFKGKVLFAATESSSGRELWITDGTGSGTRLLADLYPGSSSGNPRILGTAGPLLFGLSFHVGSCCGSPSGSFLWRSDGTREGTFQLPDPDFRVSIPDTDPPREPEASPTLPATLVLASDGVFFTGCVSDAECGLWRTDGTREGTRSLRTFGSANLSASPTWLTLAGGRLYFTIARQLWTSDGTEAGTTLVREFPSLSPHLFAALGSRALFLAEAVAPGTGEELWVSDGTAAGTRALTSFEVTTPFSQTYFLKNLGGRVYFVADDATHGAELWASDGTPAGTVRLTDFGFHDPFKGPPSIGGDGLFPTAIERVGNRLIFWASDGLSGLGPWSNTGTFASTTPLCPSCQFQDRFLRFVKLNEKLLFAGTTGPFGQSLWTTDGTAAGTHLVQEPCPSLCAGLLSDLFALPGAVYFQGPSANDFGTALWVSDGTAQGTRRYAAVESELRDRERPVAVLGGKILFGALGAEADSFFTQQELWSSDGTPAGTRQVSETSRVGQGSSIAHLLSSGGRAYFSAIDGDSARHVWRSTPAADDALKTPDLHFTDLVDRSQLVTAGGKVFLILSEETSGGRLLRVGDDGHAEVLLQLSEFRQIFYPVDFQGRLTFVVAASRDFGAGELWQSDGTVAGTYRAVAVFGLNGIGYLRAVGSELWFLAHDDSSQAEIWRTDGTQGGTVRISGLNGSRSRQDPEFTKIGSTVYFVALKSFSDDFDPQIWRSDGTPQGTALVSDFPGGNATRAFPAELTAFQGSLYFFANLPSVGRALWRSDGTTAGTVRIRDFAQPVPSHFETPHYGLTVLGNRLVFAADDGLHGVEPWSSDGTAAGTALLRDVWPGPASSAVTGFAAGGGQLYFAAHDGAHGFELWRTDATTTGTRLVQDLAPEGESSFPKGLTATADRIYFSADDGLAGEELWTLPFNGAACHPSSTALCLSGGRFQVESSWRTPFGTSGRGTAVPLSADTGYFWFFDSANVEAVLKILDGRGLNGHFWAFYGALSNVEYTLTVTDTQTGLARRYVNPQGQFASVGDTEAFGPLGARTRKAVEGGEAPLLVSQRLDPRAATGTCLPAAGRLCLNGGRFAVEALWKDFAGQTGAGTGVGLTGDTGYFWFFDPANVEVVLKVLDATSVNGHYWVFYGALSNVEYTLTVTDTSTGLVKTYRNPSGRFASAGDTAAF